MNNSAKVILIGGGGMVGRRLISDLPGKLVVTSSRQGVADHTLDLFDFNDQELDFIAEQDTVLLAAAVSSPDICKREPEYARAINVVGTERLIDACLKKGAKVIFFSSDTVYGNTGDLSADENTALNPLGQYAAMKAEIENIFQNRDGFLALRLSYVVSAHDKFSTYLNDCANSDNEAEIFHPLSRNSVWIGDLVKVIQKLIYKWPDALNSLNIGGPSLVSRVDMAKAFSKSANSNLRYKIVEPSKDFYEERPVTISMNTQQLARINGKDLSDLEQAYIKEF